MRYEPNRTATRIIQKLAPKDVGHITDRAHGPDFSKYDRWFHPQSIVGQVNFVIQRLGYGMRKDEAYDVLHPGVMEMPVRGAYGYLSSHANWRDQVNFWLDIAGDDFHFIAIDWEKYFNTVNLRFAENLGMALEYMTSQTSKKVLLYTNPNMYNNWLRYRPWVKKYPLWLAQYWIPPSPNKNPGMPKGREKNEWTLWQYTHWADSTKYGASRPHAGDLNVFNGTPSEMRKWLNIGVEDPEPKPEPKTIEERVERLESFHEGE